MIDLAELTAVGVGGLLLVTALVRAGASSWTWWRFRGWIARLVTALALLAATGAVLVYLAGETVTGP